MKETIIIIVATVIFTKVFKDSMQTSQNHDKRWQRVVSFILVLITILISYIGVLYLIYRMSNEDESERFIPVTEQLYRLNTTK